MPSKRVVIAALLSVAMVMAAGCAGWGTDDPTGPPEETDGNREAQAEEDSENDGSGGDTEETSDGAEGEGAKAPEDTSSTSGGDTDAQNGAESSNTDSDTPPSDGSDPGENTDEIDERETGGSQSGVDDDSDGSDTDESDSDDTQAPDDTDGKLTCDAFGTREEAQSYYEEAPDERTHLDADTDGVACEHLEEDDDPEEYTYSLSVQVVDEDGEPVPNQSVYSGVAHVLGDEEEYVTDENGEVEMSYTGPTENEYQDFEIIVNGERTTTTVFVGENSETVTLGDSPIYVYQTTVQVVDEDGNPISNEQVEVSTPPGESPESYTTNDNGEVTLRLQNSSPGDAVEHQIDVRGESHYIHLERGIHTEQITVGDEEREVHELTVHAGEREPIENVDVTIERWDGATTTKTTGEDGTVTFDVYAGDYTVTGVDERGEEQSVEVTVPDQQEVLLDRMDTPLGEPQTVDFTVVDKEGNPVEGAMISAFTGFPDLYIEPPPTDENGETTGEGLDGETYGIESVGDEDGDNYYTVESVNGEGSHSFTVDGETDVTVTVEDDVGEENATENTPPDDDDEYPSETNDGADGEDGDGNERPSNDKGATESTGNDNDVSEEGYMIGDEDSSESDNEDSDEVDNDSSGRMTLPLEAPMNGS